MGGVVTCFTAGPRYSPVGVFFLIVGKLMVLSDLGGTLTGLAMYMVTVLVGLVVHGCIVLPLVYLVVARRNPLKLVYGVLQALVTALATSSRLIAWCVAGCVAMDTQPLPLCAVRWPCQSRCSAWRRSWVWMSV